MDGRYAFCPKCGNLLVNENSTETRVSSDCWRRVCMTCPYFQTVSRRHCYPVFIKTVTAGEEDIVETSKADEHRQRTEVFCPKCNHNEAFFYQMQTRSADEPMTTFYECTSKKCKYNWRD